MTPRTVTLALVGAALAVGTLFASSGGLRAAEPILVGEINSYSRLPAFTHPYRNGWQLAVEEINGAGGVLGLPTLPKARQISTRTPASL